MNATTKTRVRIESRKDGRYSYRDTDLAEIRGWVAGGETRLDIFSVLTAYVPEGEVILGSDGCVHSPDNTRLIPPADGNALAQFVREVERWEAD